MQYLNSLAITLLSAFAMIQDLSPEVRANLERRIQMQRAFDGRLNSPGAELRAVEIARVRSGELSAVKYEFRTRGLPSDVEYDLLMLPPEATDGNDLRPIGGSVRVDEQDGRVMDGPDDPRYIILPEPFPGTPARFLLVAKDGKLRASAVIYPKPIEATDSGCKVSVVRLYSNFEAALVQVSGFPPEAEIAARGNSEGEIHEFKMRANANGYADAAVLPAKLGKTKGKMEMQFTTSKCAPKVSFRWGKTQDGQPYQ